jgi:hypothetical protein
MTRPIPLTLALAAIATAAPARAGDGAPAAGAGTGSPAAAIAAPFEPEAPPPAPASGPEHGKAFTCDATPVEPGAVEVELAWAPSWWAPPGSLDRAGEAQWFVLAAGVGILPDLDVRAALGWAFLRESGGSAPAARGTGPGDAAVAIRWRFLRLDSPAVDLAVVANAVAPTGTRETAASLGTGQGAWSAGGALVASVDLAPWTANAEVGGSSRLGPARGDDVGLLAANLAVGLQVAPWLQPEVELNYQHEVEHGPEADERILWGTAGVVLSLPPARVVVGARFPLWQANASAGPALTAAVKLAF